MRSSAWSPNFQLALALILGLWPAATRSGEAQQIWAATSTETSIGQALAADLTWSQPERDHRFARMDAYFPTHSVHRSNTIRSLPVGAPVKLVSGLVDGYMSSEHLSGVLVLQNGRVRLERYALGATPATRWTGFSMTKAVTDTLVGAALHDGAIRSIDDPIARYLPELLGSAYDDVSVRQVMTMTSGVRWNESYTTPDADNVRLYTTPVAPGQNSTVEYMRRLRRSAVPGSQWLYNTGETDLLGVLLRRATGKSLADQLSNAIWQHAGMEHDGSWIATAKGPRGEEFGGSGLAATLRDWGRLGLWVLDGGQDAVGANWFTEATRTQVQAGSVSYGYGWWPQPDGSFAALGIFGQSLLIDPSRKLVVVTLGDWPQATGAAHAAARAAFWQQVKTAVDAEGVPGDVRR